MKNIHVILTDKPSKIHVDLWSTFLTLNYQIGQQINSSVDSINIYITSDEEINHGDWVYCKDDNAVISLETILSVMLANNQKEKYGFKTFYKIILTTDQDLIKDGVQAIDDQFLEWFVRNLNYEQAEVKMENICARCYSNNVNDCLSAKECSDGKFDKIKYKIIIPKEEPKQETLEEASERILFNNTKDIEIRYRGGKENIINAMIEIAKWQAERMYSEEDLEVAYFEGREGLYSFNDWLKQFKK